MTTKTGTMKKICIALDYTPLSEKVAKTGYELARELGAEVTLVHVIADASYYAVNYAPSMGYQGFLVESGAELAETIELGAKNFLSATIERLHDRNIKKAVLEGPTADAILEYAQECHMDLLVVGTHGHSGLEHLLMGNTAGRLVRHSKIPILLVPTNVSGRME